MKKIIIITGIIILAGSVYFYYSKYNSIEINDNISISTEKKEISQSLTELYKNDKYNFSFKYPEKFSIVFSDIESGDVLIVSSDDIKTGFQIDIQEIDEDIGALTVDRIRQDLPDILIESPQDVILGTAGKGVAFIGNDVNFDGKTREIWFVYNKVLYQIRTYASNDALMQSILDSWKFE